MLVAQVYIFFLSFHSRPPQMRKWKKVQDCSMVPQICFLWPWWFCLVYWE